MHQNPRVGVSAGFRSYEAESYEGTLGNPEKIIWSSIKHLCARQVAIAVLYDYGIRNRRLLKSGASSLALYIKQAAEFYEAASYASSNTAPLLYYYSFMNLAKAVCEIHRPRFHQVPESYRHGISWRPNPDYVVDMQKENLSLTTRGVWHVLWESMMGQRCPAANPQQLKIRDLFAFSFDTSAEYERVFDQKTRLIELKEPSMMVDPKAKELWIKFSVCKDELKALGLSRNKLLKILTYQNSTYHQVQSGDKDFWTFELDNPKRFRRIDSCYNLCKGEIDAINLFVHLRFGDLVYSVPIQDRLPFPIPQLMVLYTIMFWLGSLVRYDPHSLETLRESHYWILIDGFITQSRIWLLELFEWELYQAETTLRHLR
jgi:hypothetical protein